MAELTPSEKLQPSLLDRLTDDEPHETGESRDRRVLNLQQLRAGVIRDLSWLLNTCDLDSAQPLEKYPDAVDSVINYGIPDLTGRSASGVDVSALEELVRQAIVNFEPRILRKSVRVRAIVSEEMSHNALSFMIEGELWARPIPLQLFLKTEIDLETGEVEVTEQQGGG